MLLWCHFGRFLFKSGSFCGRGATLWSENPLFGPKDLTWDKIMKMEFVDCRCNSCSWVPFKSRKWSLLGPFLRFLIKLSHFWPSPLPEQNVFLDYIWRFFTKLSCFCGRGATLCSANPLFSSKTSLYDHTWKQTGCLPMHNSCQIPTRAENEVFWSFLQGHLGIFYLRSSHDSLATNLSQYVAC